MYEIDIIANFFVQGEIQHETIKANSFEDMLKVVADVMREEMDAETFLIHVKCPMDR